MCPRCERVRVVPPGDAARTLEALARRAEEEIVGKMSAYARDDALKAAFQHRERIARESHFDCGLMDVRTALGCSAAIKELVTAKTELGGRPADPARLLGLVQMLGSMLLRLEKTSDLEAGTHNLLYMKKYDLNSLASADPDAFPLYPNERHVQAFVARSDLGIMTQSQAEQRAAAQPGQRRAAPGARTPLTVEEAVRDYYEHSYMLADAFFGGPVRKKYGAPPDLDQVKIPLYQLQQFMFHLPYDEGGIAVCEAGRFGELVRKVFGADCQNFERSFVASGESPGAFPLFLKIGGKVHASQLFGIFYLGALFTVVHKNEFDQETRHRSRLYESRVVPAYFEERGFIYHANQKVKKIPAGKETSKGFEIDGIAVSPRVVYVVEAKCWNPRKFLGSAGRHSAYDDMIRGSIEGTHFERKAKKLECDGHSLASKAKWVENNRGQYDIADGTPVKCMLVTNTHPIAREYKGCEIIRVEYADVPDMQRAAGRLAGGGPATPGGASAPDRRRARGRPGGRHP